MDLDSAAVIRPHERDLRLQPFSDDWANTREIPGWTLGFGTDRLARDNSPSGIPTRCYTRDFVARDKELREFLIRWPAAPIQGLNRKPHEVTLERGNYFTARVLRRAERARNGEPASRIYLIHNGLNEVSTFRFYYVLASWLLTVDDGAAVIVLPTPGHLSRYPIPSGFGEPPLERYLSDPVDLFRQYVRYTYELQWAATALAPKVHRQLCGLGAQDSLDDYELGAEALERCERDPAARIHVDWQVLNSLNDERTGLTGSLGEPLTFSQIQHDVAALRWAVFGTQAKSPDPKVCAHSIGFSLGGFHAQAALFRWPSWIASCTAICSGGPLSSVRLSEFADPSEWDAVLQGLRYELDNFLVQQKAGVDRRDLEIDAFEGDTPTPVSLDHIAGFPRARFSHLLRSFYEVFLQDFQSPYSRRLQEFVDRILFVVGGDDSIIRSENVLASAPRGGHNFLQVANLSHFVHQRNADFEDNWLPRIAWLAELVAAKGELQVAEAMDEVGETPALKARRQPRARRTEDEPLGNHRFLVEVRSLAERAASPDAGHLWVARSRPPAVLFASDAGRYEAVKYHYNSTDGMRYLRSLIEIESLLLEAKPNLTVLLSRVGSTLFSRDREAITRYPVVANGKTAMKGDFVAVTELMEERWAEHAAEPVLRYFALQDWTEGRLAQAKMTRSVGDSARRLVEEVRRKSYGDGVALVKPHRGEEASQRLPVTNVVPEAWLYVSSDLLPDGGACSRDEVQKWLLERARSMFKEGWSEDEAQWLFGRARDRGHVFQETSSWLADGKIALLKPSRSRADADFRGVRVRSPRWLADLWIRTALCYSYSWSLSDGGSATDQPPMASL